MMVKIEHIIMVILLFAVCCSVGYSVYIHGKLEDYKVEAKKEQLVTQAQTLQKANSKTDSLYNIQKVTMDSISAVLNSRASVIENKIQKQDEKLRTLRVTDNSLLPDL